MHAALELAAFWAIAFFTLGVAVVFVKIYGDIIDSDMELLSPVKEVSIGGLASLIEAVGVWLIVLFIPAASRGMGLRAMIVPLMIVALIYKIAHLESWSILEIGLLLAFQLAIGCIGASLVFGNFMAAFMVIVVFTIMLAIIASFAKGL